jgi:hypothetical protein
VLFWPALSGRTVRTVLSSCPGSIHTVLSWLTFLDWPVPALLYKISCPGLLGLPGQSQLNCPGRSVRAVRPRLSGAAPGFFGPDCPGPMTLSRLSCPCHQFVLFSVVYSTFWNSIICLVLHVVFGIYFFVIWRLLYISHFDFRHYCILFDVFCRPEFCRSRFRWWALYQFFGEFKKKSIEITCIFCSSRIVI